MRALDATRPEPGMFGGWTRRYRFIAAVPLPWRFRREEKMQRILISLGLAGLILGAAPGLARPGLASWTSTALLLALGLAEVSLGRTLLSQVVIGAVVGVTTSVVPSWPAQAKAGT